MFSGQKRHDNMAIRHDVKVSKEIQKQTGWTFHIATRLFPKRIRNATYVLYAFFRIADEVVDDPNAPPPDDQRDSLQKIKTAALSENEPEDTVLRAFVDLRERYGIADDEVTEFIAAMDQDISKHRYETFADLEGYLRGSSVAVANMMLTVMQPDDEGVARPHAKALGEAFQLTNFLRDVREDVLKYNRIYLPLETLDEHGVDVVEVEELRFSERFAATMRAELQRTEERYRVGVAGIECLPEGCQFPVLLAAVLYAEHHRLIRERGFDVLSERPNLSTPRQCAVAARTLWHWKRTGDPETAFYRASVVSDTEESSYDPAPSR
jgi:phytoene synthase